MSDYLKGELDLLYLVIDGTDYPIGCLTEHGVSEDADTIETTTQDNGGWKTSRPTNQSYTVNFTGLSVITNEDAIDRYSYDLLTGLKRSRTLVQWKEVYDTGSFFRSQSGQGYITEIGETSTVGEFITFNGVIEGYGEVVLESFFGEVDNLIFEDANNYIFEDGNNAIVSE